jgi:SAM-dependent methyltransferase
VDPRLIYHEAKAVVRALARKAKQKINFLATRKYRIESYGAEKDLTLLDWDSLAFEIHNRYGYLSHDFSVLGQVIEKTKARSVLEIGCGSGRLVPVYLAHNVQVILLQDTSERALDLCRQRFFCQKHIRYFHGDVQIIPTSASPNLIIANRILHILEDSKFDGVMNYLISMARHFYINEAGIEEAKSINWPYLKGRNYIQIFRALRYRLIEQGDIASESGRQIWMLFEPQNEIGSPSFAEHEFENLDVQHQK